MAVISILISSSHLVLADEKPQLSGRFFDLVTKKKLSQARTCMQGVAFQVVVNKHEYYRLVDKMSAGYFYGTSLSFAKNYCSAVVKQTDNSFFKKLLSEPAEARDTFKRMAKGPATDLLVHNYSILFSLGMIESEGAFDEGRDTSAWNIDSFSAEAGTYQASYDTHKNEKGETTAVPEEVYNFLMNEYQRGTSSKCLANVFSIDQILSQNRESWGWGDGYEFQEALKHCPALAADYEAYLLRVTSNVNGPLLTRQAQAKPECAEILGDIKDLLNADTCSELESFSENFTTYPEAAFEFTPERSFKELARGENSWQPKSRNEGWSYDPHYLTTYHHISGESKPIPETSEIPWIKNTIRFYTLRLPTLSKEEQVREQTKIDDLKLRIERYSKDSQILQRAVDKKESDLGFANRAIQKAKAALDQAQMEGNETIINARLKTYETLLRSRERIIQSKESLLKQKSLLPDA